MSIVLLDNGAYFEQSSVVTMLSTLKLFLAVFLFFSTDRSSIAKNVPPGSEKGSSDDRNVKFVETEHEREETAGDDDQENRMYNFRQPDNEKVYHCRPCQTVMTEIMKGHTKSEGFTGDLKDAIKKVGAFTFVSSIHKLILYYDQLYTYLESNIARLAQPP